MEGSKTLMVRRRWRVGLFLVGWTVLSLLVVTPMLVSVLAKGEAVPWSRLISELVNWYLWLLIFPAIYWVTERFPFERKRWRSWLAINLILGLVISSFYGLLALLKSQLIIDIGAGNLSFHQLRQWPNYLLSSIEFFYLVYFAIVAVLHAVSYYRKYRERALRSSRLETQLAQAKLEVLKMQLHPHFLFNTLNAISALMHHDVDAADRMITKLSDLLRLSLDDDHRQQVTLREELAFLDHYVAIEMIRFQDRLRVAMEIAPECLDAQVPKLILQPLVENAIRHGIAMRSAAGQVMIRAQRRGGRLRLAVIDDGPGLPRGPEDLRLGVGLANTRERLAQLYGDDQRFVLRNAPTGGFEAVLEVPFERSERLPVETADRPRRQAPPSGRQVAAASV